MIFSKQCLVNRRTASLIRARHHVSRDTLSASESASEKSSDGFLECSCCFFPSYTKCLTNTIECLILLVFDSYAVRASGGEPVVRE